MNVKSRIRAVALVTSLLTLAGCAAVLPTVTPKSEDGTRISLFPNRNGMGGIAVRVIDKRKGYSTQAFWDVDDFDTVRIAVSSVKKLKDVRVDEIDGDRETNTYSSDKLKALPPSDDYRLVVSLRSGDTVVGQGAATNIVLTPGQITPVTVYINSVGGIDFGSDDYYVWGDWPFELPGEWPYGLMGLVEGSTASLRVYFPWDPQTADEDQVAKVALEIFDNETKVTLVASESAHAEVILDEEYPELPPNNENPEYGEGPEFPEFPEFPPRVGVITFEVPPMPSQEPWRLYRARVYGLNRASEVITTRTESEPFIVMKGASIVVNFDDENPVIID